MVKVKCDDKEACMDHFKNFNVEVLNEKNGKYYIEFSNSKEKTEAFVKELHTLGSVKYLKSGRMFLK